jgi:hypothetical protein
VPKTIKPDPDVGRPLTVVVQRLGRFFGRDYSVHEGSYPATAEEVREQMWLWFNKSEGKTPREAIIDLENFNRGTKEDKDKGGVLYTARIDDKPVFDKFHRTVGSSRESFLGFFTGHSHPIVSYEDAYYLNHHTHTAKRVHGGRDLVTELSRCLLCSLCLIQSCRLQHPEMITKWRLMTKAYISDGDQGRAADLWQKKEVVLDVFSTGTVVTTWQEVERHHTDKDGHVSICSLIMYM